jgi:pyruvate-ferredoxin/flavodoxin oxidoreductase
MRKLKTMDGNTAARMWHTPSRRSPPSTPITPSSPMAELIDACSATGLKNIFGQQVRVVEMQSRAAPRPARSTGPSPQAP